MEIEKLCLTCETSLKENTKPIEQWKDNETKIYCPKCKEWKTASIGRFQRKFAKIRQGEQDGN